MWSVCLALSIGCAGAAFLLAFVTGSRKLVKKPSVSPFNMLFAGAFLAALLLFLPIHTAANGRWQAFLLAVFNSMQVFTIGCEFAVVKEAMSSCPEQLVSIFELWAAVIYVFAPVLTFGFVLSLFNNLSSYLKYLRCYFREAYVFSELNEKSLVLASDIRQREPKASIIFADVFDGNEEKSFELSEAAKKLGAICFKKDVLVINFNLHSAARDISFFAIDGNETENLNQALKLIEQYRHRANTHLYVFSTKMESELLLTAVDKGQIKVRRINEVQSLVNRVLYERGQILFDHARTTSDGIKTISAVIVGMGRHGTEMVKALSWFGQMDGYKIEIHGFDKDPLAQERFTALAPELMSPDYNGVEIPGEAQYKIAIHGGLDVETVSFARQIGQRKDATYVLVSLGDDDVNVKTAVNLRMYFERMGVHPDIQAIVYNSQQKKALEGIRNYRGQAYDIEFIGDLESSYIEKVIIDSELEEDALRRHLKWGKEEEFWAYEYNYRSSMASAIHKVARIKCGIPGADKKEEELTEQERHGIEVLEHRRWNAYMRAEGYIFSGSTDKASRNDLAKMHHDLVDFSSLTEEEKRKDSKVGTN